MYFDHLEEKEAVKKAALLEENGFKFYTLLAENTADEKARAVFKQLAGEETRHLKLIESRFFPEAGYGEQITDEELAIEAYIEKTGGADIFTKRIDVDALVRLIDHPRKALIVALDTERHSVEFFDNLSQKAGTEEARTIYKELADEERSHVRHIEVLLAEAPPF
jgi:rubrerythrin